MPYDERLAHRVRVGPEASDDAIAQPLATEVDFTGRPLKGMVYVEPAGIVEDGGLKQWVDRGATFAGNLPPK